MNKLTDRKQMIQQGFDTVAPGYDLPSLFFFPETAQQLIELLDLQGDENLLDVCTGTGMVSVAAAEKLTKGHVTGIDLSQGMLDQARAKADSRGIYNLDLIQMDLEQLNLKTLDKNKPFDIATSSFGLFFLEDMTAGLQNITSTVKPGGKIAITSFSGEAFAPFADMFIKHFEATGRTVPPLSWKRLATEELIREQYAAVGVSDVEIHHLPLGKQITDEQQWWDIVWNAGWRALLNQMEEQERGDFEQYHRKHIEQMVGKDGEWLNTEVLIAVGHKQ